MNRKWLPSLLLGLAGCDVQLPPEMQLTHRHERAMEQQIKQLQAENVAFSVASETVNDSTTTFLDVDILNSALWEIPPNSLPAEAYQLAHLLVTDLINPTDYSAVRITIKTEHNYLVAETHNSHTYSYPLNKLR